MSYCINLSYADPRTEIVARICGKEHVQNVSNYFMYYSRITDYMQDEIYRNKFAFKDVGKPPDRLYVLSQCMDDLSADECVVCFTQINTLIPGCFPNTGGRVYLDGCFIRAENYTFYREALGNQDTKRCGPDANTAQEFREAVEKVLEGLLLKAPTAGPIRRGFAMQHESAQGMAAYGMASCWKILDTDLCYTCLSDAIASALSCLPSTEARVLNAGCFLRYADFSFANETPGESRGDIFSYIAYIFGIVIACLTAIGIGVCVGKHTYRRKNGIKAIRGMEDLLLLDEGRQFLQFNYATIRAATENFNEVLRLGQGGFGEVYKGTLPDGREIAIKRLYVGRKNGVVEICNEMDIISRAQHKNLKDPAKQKELTWEKRLLIITGTAEGLEYLHKDCQEILPFSSITQSWKHFKSNSIPEIIDPSMEIEDIEEIERVIQIGLLCTQESPSSRPTMTKVVQMLRRKDLEVPRPSKPPFTDEHMELCYLGTDYQRRHSTSD
ncbi:conserved hypothetical protein [Ricinus communis]|uniref:Uncharacterized protein n=1 Tax=Ricinus communis TaxID=3988 RepID=B9SF99_RICCO|nr:conserved hypothetical protein [Ricinus communis]